MKKKRGWNAVSTTAAAALLFLGGCTADLDGKDAQGFSPYLTVDLRIPENIAVQQQTPLTLEVKQSGAPFAHAEVAEFAVWPEGNEAAKIVISADEQAPGQYAAEHAFAAEGIYVLQSRVASGKLEVTPAKRIAIGQEAVGRLAILEAQRQTGQPAAPEAAGGHH